MNAENPLKPWRTAGLSVDGVRPLRTSLILLAILGLGAAAYGWFRSVPRGVEVVAARLGPAVELVYATGYVEPRRPVSVVARTTAPVRDVLVEEGDSVRRGQPLLLLDDREQRMLLDQAAAVRVRATLDERRALTLYGQGWVARAARDEAVATATGARAGEAAARVRLDQMVVRAGIDGVVLKRDVQPGDLATPSRALLQIGNVRDLWVTATVDERDVPQLRIRQQALLKSDAWPGRVIPARLVELTPGGDPTQRAFRVRIVPDDRSGLPIGLSLEVNIVVWQKANTVLVPNNAVSDGAVWKIVDGRAVRQPVRVGIAGSELTEVSSGLKPGEMVILNPTADLAPGVRVKPAGPAKAR